MRKGLKGSKPTGFTGPVARAALAAVAAVCVAVLVQVPGGVWDGEAGGLAFAVQESALTAGDAEGGFVPAGDAPQPAVWDGSADTSWYDPAAESFTLESSEQVAGLAAIASGVADGIEQDTFEGKTIALSCDLILNAAGSARNWVPIADINRNDGTGSSAEVYFDGTFDGAGHRVFGLRIDPGDFGADNNYGGYQAFFGSLGPHAVVRDLGIESGQVKGRVAAGIAAVSHVSDTGQVPQIVGCYNKADIVGNGSSSRGAGGIFAGEDQMGSGHSSTVTDDYRAAARIYDCYNQGNVVSTGPAGGIAGTGSVQVRGCYNSGSVRSLTDGSGRVGALVANLMAPGYLTAGGLAANGTVAHSYASDDSCVNLFRIFDAAHDDLEPGFPSQIGTSTTKFLPKADLAVASALLGASFVDDSLSDPANGRFPLLYWQAGLARIGIDQAYAAPLADQKYTAAPICPTVEVRAAKDGAILIEGCDYLVSYEDNVEVGRATVVIDGVGRYLGQRRDISFDITTVDLAECAIDPIKGCWFYGDPVTPDVTVRTQGETVLRQGDDYEVVYADNDHAGIATAKVVPAGPGVTGSQETTFALVAVSQALEGSGSADDPYLIGEKGDLQLLSRLVNTGVRGYASAHYLMTRDIDAAPTDESPVTIDPIGLKFHPFAGSFDGGGHTLTLGMRLSELSDYIFEDPYDNGWMNLALFCSTPRSTDEYAEDLGGEVRIENLTIDGFVESRGSVAAFVGSIWDADVTIANCTNKAQVRRTGTYASQEAGGFVSYASWRSHIAFTNCVNEGTVSGAACAAGFIGQSVSNVVRFEGCVNAGAIESERIAGGFIAEFQPNSGSDNPAHFEIENCANTGDVVTHYQFGAAGGFLGGINESYASMSNLPSEIVACYNAGNVCGSEGVGGLVGKTLHTPIQFGGCYNVGTVTNECPGDVDRAGGIMGFAGYYSERPWVFAGVYNAGQLVNVGRDGDVPAAGGILGCAGWYANVRISDAYYVDTTAPTGIAVKPEESWSATVEGAPQAISRAALAATGPDGGANLLGSVFYDDSSAEPKNGGYPVLYWQLGFGKRDLDDDAIVVGAVQAQRYTGTPLEPGVQIVDTARGYVLRDGTDYVLSYENNVNVEGVKGSGTPTLIVTGRGAYQGVRTAAFDIEPMPLGECDIADIDGMWCGPDMPAVPDIVIYAPSRKITRPTLVEGEDYELEIAGNDTAGQAVARITGIGNFSGTVERTFTVREASRSLEGSGSQADPYLVGTPADLQFVAFQVNAGNGAYPYASYRLIADVDATADSPVDSIGTAEHPFMGSFDGAGHAIARTVERPSSQASVFGSVHNAMLTSIAVEGDIATTDVWRGSTASLAAFATGSLTVEDCVNRAHLRSPSSYLGGLIGRIASSEGAVRIARCRNEASFGEVEGAGRNGNAYVGGIVGTIAALDARIVECCNTAPLAADEYVGGIVGCALSSARQTKLAVKRCYNSGAISCEFLGGGLVGYAMGNVDLAIADSYNTGAVSGSGLSEYVQGIGGIVGGQATGTLDIARTYNAGTVTGSRDGSAVAGGIVGELESRVSRASIARSLYLAGCPDASVGIDAAAHLDDGARQADGDALKDASALAVLGSAFGADTRLVNGGFPVLGMQRVAIDGFMSGAIADQVYTGFPIEPAPVFVDMQAGAVLVNGIDYTVTYAGNVDAGTASMTFVGMGGYTGTKTVEFAIVPARIEDCDIPPIGDVPLGDAGAVPALAIVNVSGVQLVEGVDYSVGFSGNKAPGDARATIVGMGNYEGVAVVPFNVVARVTLTESHVSQVPEQRYTGLPITPDVTVTVAGAQLAIGVDYDVEYEDNVQAGEAAVVVTGKGRYKGIVRIPFSIVKADIASATVDDIDDVAFDGTPAEPRVTLRKGDSVLVEGRDYEVEYLDNAEPGTARVVIEGRGLYDGRIEASFEIEGLQIRRADIDPIPDVPYADRPVEPPVTVRVGGAVLTRDVDYDLIYSNNIEPGTAFVTVIGKGRYSGEAQATFNVVDSTGAAIGATVAVKTAQGTLTVRVLGAGSVALCGIADAASGTVSVDAVAIGGRTYQVTRIMPRAFAGTDVTTVVLGKSVSKLDKRAFAGAPKLRTVIAKTAKLAKKRVKGCFAGSRVKTVKVKVGSKKQNKKYVKKYRKTLGKKRVSGKKVKVRL